MTFLESYIKKESQLCPELRLPDFPHSIAVVQKSATMCQRDTCTDEFLENIIIIIIIWRQKDICRGW